MHCLKAKIKQIPRKTEQKEKENMNAIEALDEFYAAMKRSTNGGGENSPVLIGEDDPYELFFAGLQEQLQ